MIGIADKALDEIEGAAGEKTRHKVRREFWTEVLKAMAPKINLFQNISPNIYGWIGAGSGVRGVGFNFAAGRSYGRAELYIDRGDREENKFIFDQLYAKKTAIENVFGQALTWERLDDKRASRIKAETSGSIFDPDQWPTLIEFMTDAMVRLETTFKEPLASINRRLRNRALASSTPGAAALPAADNAEGDPPPPHDPGAQSLALTPSAEKAEVGI